VTVILQYGVCPEREQAAIMLERADAQLLEVLRARGGSHGVLVAQGSLEALRAVDGLAPAAALWHADSLGCPGQPSATPGRLRVVVERRFPGSFPAESLCRPEARAAWCLSVHGSRYLGSYFSLAARRSICLYEAPDLESVRQTQRTLGLPVHRIWSLAEPAARAPSGVPRCLSAPI
jgi:hypothetical protein